MSTLLDWDYLLFQQINQRWTHPLLDQVMPFLTDLHRHISTLGIVLLALGLGFWLYRQRKRALKALLVSALAFAVTDAFSYRVLKNYINRNRPEKTFVSTILRSHSHSGQSFPSNHSANSFAVAQALSFCYPALRWVFYGLAVFVGYSRVYVGVHYPSDVLAGATLGILLATLIWFSSKRLRRVFIQGVRSLS